MSNNTSYEAKAVTTKIQATYRISAKFYDNFHTVEYTEERQIPNVDGVNLLKEKEALWNDVIVEIENQMEDIEKSYQQIKNKKS